MKPLSLEELNQKMLAKQLASHLNFVFTEATPARVKAQVTISEIHARSGGIMSGGTTLALIETVGSVAGMLQIDIQKQNVFGIEVNANHLAQVPIGETITATAEPDHVGRSTQVWRIQIHNSKMKLVCVGRITLVITNRS